MKIRDIVVEGKVIVGPWAGSNDAVSAPIEKIARVKNPTASDWIKTPLRAFRSRRLISKYKRLANDAFEKSLEEMEKADRYEWTDPERFSHEKIYIKYLGLNRYFSMLAGDEEREFNPKAIMHYQGKYPELKQMYDADMQQEINTLTERKRKRKRSAKSRTVYGGWWGGYYGDNSSAEGGGEDVAEAVVDVPQQSLSDIFTQEGKLQPQVRQTVMSAISVIQRKFPENKILDYYMVGAAVTFQYSKSSDIDTSIVYDPNTDPSRIAEIYTFCRELEKKITPFNDARPYQFTPQTKGRENTSNADAVYDVKNDKWIKQPSYQKVAGDYEALISKPHAEVQKTYSVAERTVQSALLRLLSELNKNGLDENSKSIITRIYKYVYGTIKNWRSKGYEKDPGSRISQNWSTGNVIYKMFDREDYGKIFEILKTMVKNNFAVDASIVDDLKRQLQTVVNDEIGYVIETSKFAEVKGNQDVTESMLSELSPGTGGGGSNGEWFTWLAQLDKELKKVNFESLSYRHSLQVWETIREDKIKVGIFLSSDSPFAMASVITRRSNKDFKILPNIQSILMILYTIQSLDPRRIEGVPPVYIVRDGKSMVGFFRDGDGFVSVNPKYSSSKTLPDGNLRIDFGRDGTMTEASSAAQQAAIAISMKRAGKKPKHNK